MDEWKYKWKVLETNTTLLISVLGLGNNDTHA